MVYLSSIYTRVCKIYIKSADKVYKYVIYLANKQKNWKNYELIWLYIPTYSQFFYDD